MPNWVDNNLEIIVPAENADALKAAMKGPSSWHYPTTTTDLGIHSAKLSNHDAVALEQNAETEIAKFRADHDLPDWMPVTREDIIAHKSETYGRDKDVPFSVAALRPWSGREEFDKYYKGEMQGSFWVMTSEDRTQPGWYRRNNDVLGVKWTPGEVSMEEDAIGDGRIHLHIKYQTPWGAIQDLASLLGPTLELHGAKARLTWVEEQGFVGFDYINPATNTYLSESLGADDFYRTYVEDGEEFNETDHELVDEAVSSRVGDPDF